MATTSKELIEILQKYTDPDEIVIWQYYTRHDFALDELIKALDAEAEHQKTLDDRRAQMQRMNAEYQERQKAEANA
jgi:hypothetical protein